MKKLHYLSGVILTLAVMLSFTVRGEDLKDYFRGLPIKSVLVSGNVELSFKQSDDTHVKISGEFKDIDATCKSGVLKIISKSKDAKKAIVYVTHLESVEIQNGAVLATEEVFVCKKIDFEVESDAKITKLQLDAKKVDFSLKGGTVTGVQIKGDNVDLDLDKVSTFQGSVENLKKIDISASARSKVDLKGETKKLNITSDAADITAMELEAADVSVKLQNAANATVNAKNTLKIDMTTAASLKYKGSAALEVKKLTERATIAKEE